MKDFDGEIFPPHDRKSFNYFLKCENFNYFFKYHENCEIDLLFETDWKSI